MGSGILFERAVIIGTGLIGGSVALAAREAGIVGTLVGVARTEATRQRALAEGVVDEARPDAQQAISEHPAHESADLVYIAVPLDTTAETLRSIAPALSPECLVTDAGSVKGSVVRDAESALTRPDMFVGGHPMAGSEKAGVAHARADLFRGRAYFLTPTASTSEEALARAKALVEALGAELLIASPAEHDDIAAAVSHLPHVAAVALMSLVARSAGAADPDPAQAMRLRAAAGGFRDMTRIAASPRAMWRAILEANREAVLRWLDHYIAELDAIGATLRHGDWASLEELLAAAGDARRNLD